MSLTPLPHLVDPDRDVFKTTSLVSDTTDRNVFKIMFRVMSRRTATERWSLLPKVFLLLPLEQVFLPLEFLWLLFCYPDFDSTFVLFLTD